MSLLASVGAAVEETETQEEGGPSPIRRSLIWKPVSSRPRLLGLGPLLVSLGTLILALFSPPAYP